MSLNSDQIQRIYSDRRGRYEERDRRMQRVRDALTGDLAAHIRRLGTEAKEPAVGNLVLSTVRTLAQRVGKMPRLHATSRLESTTAKERAERHEKEIALRLDRMRFASLLPQAAYWLASSGFQPFLLTNDKRLGQSRIRLRDPMHCYPNTVWPNEPGVDDCMFVYQMFPSEIAFLFPNARLTCAEYEGRVTVNEWHTDQETIISVVDPDAEIIERIPNPTGKTNVWIARDLTPDFDFYGQFDQVVPIMEAEARLTALMEAYAEQQVTAETVVIGEISSNDGDWAHGTGAVNTIEPTPGASVSKLVNSMSPQVFQQLALFERQQRLTGSIPAALSGEPEVSFATGRGIEKLVAVVDDNVTHYQNVLATTIKEVLATIPSFEEVHGYDTTGFAPDVTVHPQFASGTDPAMTVRLLQLVGAKVMSRSSAMDQLPEFENPRKEEAIIETEALREALLQSVLAAAQQGAGDNMAIIEMIEAREKGKPLEQALREYYERLAQGAATIEETAPPGGPESPLDLASMLGLTPGGNAVGGIMGRQEIV